MRILCLKAKAATCSVVLSLLHATAQASALPHDMSPLGMFFAADQVVKSVLIGLLIAALATWVVLLVKGASLLQARRAAAQAVAVLKTATSLPDA
ncbi:MAG: tonB-system energizer ExbB, partial [Janthinobacterium sp.]